MRYTEQKFTLDIHETMSSVSLSVKKGDTARRLLIHLADNGYPYHISEDCYAVFTAKKPDGKVVFNNCRIEDCVIIYEFTDQTVAAAGLMDCEVIIYGSSGQQLTSACFSIIVEDTIYDAETEVESTDEYNALADLIGKNQKLFSYGPVAQAIVRDADGAMISVTDASNQTLQGLRIFGKSTQNSTPTPENPVEIVSLGASGSITAKVKGKNIASSFVYASFSKDYASLVVCNDTGAVKKGKTYTISVTLTADADTTAYWNNLSKFFSHEVITVTAGTHRYSKTFTALADGITGAERILVSKSATGDGVAIKPSDCQIELGTVATDFEITDQSLVISTPNGLRGIPVTSGGNYIEPNGQQWICDEVDLARGVYVKRIEKAVLNGNSSDKYTYNTMYGDAVRFDVKGVTTYQRSDIALCTHLPLGSIGSNNAEICNIHGLIGYPIIQILSSRLESVDASGLQKYLADNPITIYYVLKNPIETKLTDAQIAAYAALHTYKPNTTVYNDAGAYMAAAYVADTKIYIDRRPSGASGSAATIGEITLRAADWVGDDSPYSQVVKIDGVTAYSQVDLTPSVEQLSVFYYKDLAFVTENDGGVVTVYAIGQKPENDYTIQVTITEVYV